MSSNNTVTTTEPQPSPRTSVKLHPRRVVVTTLFLSLTTLAIFIIGLGVRLYDLYDEPLDFHPTRQLRNAIIARGIYYKLQDDADPEMREQAISFWYSTGQYEPSFLENLVARAYLLMGAENVWVSRIFTSLFWIIGGIFLFLLARRMLLSSSPGDNGRITSIVGWAAVLVAVSYYLLLPFGVQASRSFQPDPGMVMWIILCIFCLYRWSETLTWRWVILAGIFGGIAILTKIVAGYILGVTTLVLVIYTLGMMGAGANQGELSWIKKILQGIKRILFNPQVWVMALLMLAPSFLYYIGRGGRASEYFTSWTLSLSHLLLDPGFYVRWLSLVESLMGLAVIFAALIGLLIARPRNRALLLGLWLGYGIYGLFFPYQMYTHNYYHLPLIPIIALSLVSVIVIVLERLSKQSRIWQALSLAVFVSACAYGAWLSIFPMMRDDYGHEPAYWADIGALLPSDGKILALTQDYGYRLMYYGWRKVNLWPTRGEVKLSELRGSEKEFDQFFEKRIADKSYFVITAFNQFNDQPVLQETLYERYPIYAEGSGYLIFDLTNPFDQDNP